MVHLLEDFQPVTTTQLVQKKVCIHRNWTSRHLFCWSYKSLSKDSLFQDGLHRHSRHHVKVGQK